MRKILYTLLALVAYGGSVCAQSLTVDPDPVEVIQGGKGDIVINVDPGTTETGIRAFQFDVKLPVGITLIDSETKLVQDLIDRRFSLTVTQITGTDPRDPNFEGTRYRFQVNSQQQQNYMSGVILKMKIIADPSLAIGTELPAQLVGAFGANANPNVHLTGQDGSYNLEDINFTIKIVGLVLDEEQTEIPDLADFIGQEVNLKVKRSITGGNWSTICLPFAMTTEQIEAAFGEGTKVCEFVGCENTLNKQDEEKLDIIHVKFTTTTEGMEANHPYLIKTTNTITYDDGFDVEGVIFAGYDEDGARLDLDETKVGKPGKYTYYYNSFVGQYTATSTLGVEYEYGVLFIAANTFYRATGTSTMKAFRGYFDLQDLGWLLSSNSSANITIFVDGETTDIDAASVLAPQVVEGIYDLQGRKMNGDLNSLQKGIYIVNGKKMTVK